MVYDIALWIALIVFGVGVVHRIDAWFLRTVGSGDRTATPGERFRAGLRGLGATVFGTKLLALLRTVVVDVLLQGRILRDTRDRLAWVMHVCIFYGFLLLLFFHALGSTFDRLISSTPYMSTVNPFMFLRNVSGALLVIGLVLAIVRRVVRRREISTGAADVAVLAILAIIAVSGFVLEAAKISSDTKFVAMQQEYAGGLSAEETSALRAYWVTEYGLITPTPVPSHDAAVVAQGRTIHEAACQACHARPSAAFVSYPLSRAIAPAAGGLGTAGALSALWYLHVLACCAGLAYVAFSKMFHVVSTPVSLVVAEVSDGSQTAAAAATRQAIELDGCGHGGVCHEGCPVFGRRLARIGGEQAYAPMLAYIGRKSAADLGSRPVSG